MLPLEEKYQRFECRRAVDCVLVCICMLNISYAMSRILNLLNCACVPSERFC